MDLKRAGRRGLTAAPIDGWPLDHLLVGVATLRTTRQILRSNSVLYGGSVRPWDVALWSGVTPQGTGHCMERLCRAGLVRKVAPDKPWHATTYRLVDRHPLVEPLSELFRAERAIAGPIRGLGRSGRYGKPAGLPNG